MVRALLIAAIMAIPARAAERLRPSEFYVVSVFFFDYGPQFYYRVIDVKQEGQDSLVRYVRIAPSNVYCPRIVVEAAEARLRNNSPAQLLGRNNPCAIRLDSLHAALKKYAQRASHFEAVSFGVVAQCGRSFVSLGIPIAESVNMAQMKAARPDIAALWDLAADVTVPAFGEKDIFHDPSEREDLALQATGAKLAPELISGRYDIGLAAAVKGMMRTKWSPSFRSLLASYHGPVSEAEANLGYAPQLLNAASYKFSRYVLPRYPPLAAAAGIRGTVELQLTVEPSTGEVHSVSVISGRPLLRQTAIEAAKQWRFVPDSVESGSLVVTIDFALHCP
ncbi:MAG: energy transducer TonB [Bryobacteraceae bacterium]